LQGEGRLARADFGGAAIIFATRVAPGHAGCAPPPAICATISRGYARVSRAGAACARDTFGAIVIAS
jgi:hypothetical protein